jgi:ketosteroid isomerase-like protein
MPPAFYPAGLDDGRVPDAQIGAGLFSHPQRKSFMKKSLWAAACSVFVWLPPVAKPADQDPSPATLARLDTYRAELTAAMRSESLDGALLHLSEHARLLPPYNGTVFGRANVRAYQQAFFGRFDIRDYRREPLKTWDLGSRLIEAGRLKMSLVATGDTRTHEIGGGYMDIWEQTKNGPPRLITQVWNTDRYPEIADALRLGGVPQVRVALEAHVPIKDDLSFELAALNKLHEAAVTQHDAEVWAMFFSPDALLLANHYGPLQGLPAIREHLVNHTRDLSTFEKLDIRNDAVDSVGRFVIEYASHVANWRRGDSSGVNTGKNIRVWRREPDGRLKMICGIGSYD